MVKQLKTQRLCEELNMNFDEANELFADETLQSMQMARVVGGGTAIPPGPILWKTLINFISAAADLVTLQEAITGKKGTTVSPDHSLTIIIDNDTVKIESDACSFNGKLNGEGKIELYFKSDPAPSPTPLPKN